MKSPRLDAAILISVLWLAGFAAPDRATGQEDMLDMAMKDQDRRKAGLTALITRVKGLVTPYLPEWLVPREEEAPPVPETSARVSVREVKVAEDPTSAATAAQAAANQQAELERAYREALQVAVSKLNITGTFPQRKQIMVGAQNLAVGDELAIQFRERTYSLEIVDITASELKLKDRESRLQVNLAIGVSLGLPPGMSRTPPPGAMDFPKSSVQAAASASEPNSDLN